MMVIAIFRVIKAPYIDRNLSIINCYAETVHVFRNFVHVIEKTVHVHENCCARVLRILTVWSIKFDELKEAVEFKGCQAIRSNAESNPFVALKLLYRQRQIIEQGFKQLKNEVGGSRFEATEAAYRGKLFVYTLA